MGRKNWRKNRTPIIFQLEKVGVLFCLYFARTSFMAAERSPSTTIRSPAKASVVPSRKERVGSTGRIEGKNRKGKYRTPINFSTEE